MPTPTVKTKFAIDGEKEYKAAVADISTGLKTLSSEMTLVKARYADNADSVEALTKKQDVLYRQITTQKEKIDKLRESLTLAANTYGEADSRTQGWQQQLNRAETELIGMERSLNQTTDAISRQTDGVDGLDGKLTGLGDLLDGVGQKFGVSLPASMRGSLNGMLSVNTGALAVVGTLAAVAVAAVKVEKALIGMTEKSAEAADSFMTLSATTNLSTDTLQEMEYASELLDVSVDTISGSLTKLTRSMGDAADGSATAQEKFDALGVSIYDSTDGSLRPAEDVFYDIIDALGSMANETERDSLAMDIMGKSAQDLNPLIKAGSGAMKALADEAHATGYVMDTEMLQSLGAVDDAQQRLLKTQESVTNQISAKYAPYMTEALGDTQDFILRIGDALTESGAVESLGAILTSVSNMLDPLATITEGVLPILAVGLKAVQIPLAAVADLVQMVLGLITRDGERFFTALGLGSYFNRQSNLDIALNGKIETTGNSYDSSTGLYSGNYYSQNAAGDDYFRGGGTWVGESGPERVLLPQGAQILTAQESRSGGDVFNITISAKDVQDISDIVAIARDAARLSRMRGARK